MFQITLLGLLGAVLQLQEPSSSQTSTPSPTPANPDENRDLQARVEWLEHELQLLRLRLPEESSVPAEPGPTQGSTSANALNPTITAFGNALYRYDDAAIATDEGRIDNQFNLREVELDFRAAVDPFADAVLVTAFESPLPGEFELGVEEGYVLIKTLPLPVLDEPPLGLKLKVGRFRTDVGRVNRTHLHDLIHIHRPLASDEFFGEEGYISQGLSAQLFIPTPFDEESALELTAQLLTGGGVAVADGPVRSPAFVGNLRWFRTIAAAHNLDLALIFHHGRTEADTSLRANTFSADFLYKWKPLRGGEFQSFVLGGQVLYSQRRFTEIRQSEVSGEPELRLRRKSRPFGYFAYAQYQFARPFYAGVRWDDTRTLIDDALERRAVSGYLTWYTTEFLRFRLGYEHRFSDIEEEDGRNSVFAELNFVFGAHPPESFWVNR